MKAIGIIILGFAAGSIILATIKGELDIKTGIYMVVIAVGALLATLHK